MTVSLTKQTPSEWLLERFDSGAARRATTTHVRRIVEIIDDHRSTECESCAGADCRFWSGAARWPVPNAYAELSREAYGRPWSQDFLEMMNLEAA